MRWIGVWASFGVGLALLCVGCSNPCTEVAEQLRQCCAKGPAELRESCEAEARQLEDDGNSEACESALDQHRYEGCMR